jgi:hypothetical protein
MQDKRDMKRTWLICGVSVLVCATVLGGVIHGRMSGRWGAHSVMKELASRLQKLPNKVGPWQMRAPQPLSEAAERTLECAGYISGQYENEETGEVVSMFVLLGPAGPISVHTPDVCYSSREYIVRKSPKKIQLSLAEGLKNELWVTTMQSTQLDASCIRVYYGWSTGGAWSAPNVARFAFAGQPYLYKIQVSEQLPTADSDESSDASRKFLKAMLPVVKDYMAEPEGR